MATFLLLLVLIIFVVWPVVRLYLAYASARRKVRDAFGSQFGGRNRRQPEPEPKAKKKKIDPNVGEYVSFEEITTQTTTTDTQGNTTTSYQKEQQIIDAEWEDLPPRP